MEKLGYIDFHAIDCYMRYHRRVTSDCDIKAFIRVVSIDEDTKITYSDFIQYLTP